MGASLLTSSRGDYWLLDCQTGVEDEANDRQKETNKILQIPEFCPGGPRQRLRLTVLDQSYGPLGPIAAC